MSANAGMAVTEGGGGEGEGDGLCSITSYGKAPPGSTFFTLQVYEEVRISAAEVYERIGKSVI